MILLISCSQDVWLKILNPDIEYPGMARLPIMMHNFIKTHVRHNVGPVVDTYFSYDGSFVHICRTIEYGLLLGRVTLQTWSLNTFDMLVVIPITFRRSDANIFNNTWQPTIPATLVNGFVYILCHRYDFPSLMTELVHIYDVWNENVLDQNVSCSVQNWSIVWHGYSSDWWKKNFLINRTIAMSSWEV